MTQAKKSTQKYRPLKKYNKNKKGKQIVANFGLRKYREGKSVGKSFYMEYNTDGQYYTPTFIEENVTQKNTPEDYQKDYEKRIKRSKLKGPGQMKVPKPRGNATGYCAVCKVHYQVDYFEHIAQEGHISKRDNDKYQKMILKLEKFYLRRKQRRWEKIDQKRSKRKEPHEGAKDEKEDGEK